MSESSLAKKVRVVVTETCDKHVGEVRRSELAVSTHFFYMATCSCGFFTDALTDVKLAAKSLENHIKDEVIIAVGKATKRR